ncbi:hypothetical protein AD940_00745 [Gluconobacter thailandicus]|nr:hypothetical protein AD940_00745 [Gluconobacter thailandicus]
MEALRNLSAFGANGMRDHLASGGIISATLMEWNFQTQQIIQKYLGLINYLKDATDWTETYCLELSHTGRSSPFFRQRVEL